MKNFFIRIVAIALTCTALPVAAGVRSITEEATAPANPEKRLNELDKLYRELPDVNNKKAITEYIKKRLPLLHCAQIDSSELATPGATSIVDTNSPTPKEEHVLSAYEKIYQESIQRAGNMDNTVNEDVELKGTFYRLKQQQAENNAQPVLNFPYVTVKLSDEREILAPADEHFPYVLTTIKIEPTGLLKVTEDFTFISNNESFPQGFFRILPKYNYSRNGEQRRTDISLVSVTVNGEEKPYKMTEIGNYIYIEPKEPLDLPTGIYRYRFNYVIDRAVWYYDNFDELFWDITAKTLKNVVGSANAVVYLPSNRSFIAQNAIASTRRGIDAKRVTINALTPGALGFADTEALGVGEDIHLYLTMEKGTLLPPDFSKKYQWFIHDYGACFFALLALVAIFLSYKISLEQIRRNKDKTNIYLKKTPALYRLLNANVYDAKSFGAEILSLCAKNILGLQQNDGRIALIKKSDDLRHLSLTEKKLVIAGGPSHSEGFYEEVCRAVEDDDTILMTGFVQGQELQELYSNAYLYVLPSDIEGMPMSLMEALSYGNVCLVSDIPENTEIINEDCYVFKRGDVDRLRHQLKKLLNLNLRTHSNMVIPYTWQEVVRQTLELYTR